jgi:hypothetical protein
VLRVTIGRVCPSNSEQNEKISGIRFQSARGAGLDASGGGMNTTDTVSRAQFEHENFELDIGYLETNIGLSDGLECREKLAGEGEKGGRDIV